MPCDRWRFLVLQQEISYRLREVKHPKGLRNMRPVLPRDPCEAPDGSYTVRFLETLVILCLLQWEPFKAVEMGFMLAPRFLFYGIQFREVLRPVSQGVVLFRLPDHDKERQLAPVGAWRDTGIFSCVSDEFRHFGGKNCRGLGGFIQKETLTRFRVVARFVRG